MGNNSQKTLALTVGVPLAFIFAIYGLKVGWEWISINIGEDLSVLSVISLMIFMIYITYFKDRTKDKLTSELSELEKNIDKMKNDLISMNELHNKGLVSDDEIKEESIKREKLINRKIELLAKIDKIQGSRL